MKKTIPALLFVLASMLVISCQKEISGEIISLTGGNSTGNKDSYSPTTTGTWWKYKDSTSGITTTTTIADRTKTVNGIVYKAMVGDAGTTDTGWIASPQPDYYIYQKGVSPNSGASYDVLFHYLNDTASVGSHWKYQAGQGNGFTAFIETTIMERNITMTVAGKSYQDVIHTQLVWTYEIFGQAIDAMQYDYFTAKGVGIIKIRSTGLTLLSGFQACTDLVDYSIK